MSGYGFRQPRKVSILMLLLVIIPFAMLCCVSVAPALQDIIVSVYYQLFPRECIITGELIEISSASYNPANNLQNSASVWMGTFDGKLYFSPRWCAERKYRNKYYNYLACFEGDTIKRLFRIQDSILGISNNYIYYSSWLDGVSGDVKERIYCYDFQNDTEEIVCETNFLTSEHYFSEDNLLFLSLSSQEGPYHLVNGTNISGDTSPPQSYILNGLSYSVYGTGDSTNIVVTDEIANKYELKYDTPLGRQSLIPCKKGLLVHNEGEGNALYLIPDNSEEIVQLFEIPCTKAISAVNVYDDWAYVSISRYYYDEKSDSTVPFVNDHLAGTYRIDLSDYSVEKISDSIYNGLYIFDDSGIYACTEKLEIYRFDFSGKNVTRILGCENSK